MIVHDLAYGDIVFDGYQAPAFSGQRGKGGGSRVFTLFPKATICPVGEWVFAVGNAEMLAALARLKSYFDYGVFQPIPDCWDHCSQ